MKGIVRKVSLILFLLFTLILLFESTKAEKILVLAFVCSKSHKITYMRLIEELARKGHDITVVSPVKAMKVVPNIKEIFTFDTEKEYFSTSVDPIKMKQNKEFFNPLSIMDSVAAVCQKSLGLPQVRELLDKKFDLIFMQPVMNECALGLVYKLNAPLVLFSPGGVPDMLTSKLGTRLPTSFVPHFMLDYTDDMSFWQRFHNFGITTLVDLFMVFLEPRMEEIYREALQDDSIPSIREILGNASILLSNGHFSIGGPRPYSPDIIDVGGIHSRPAKPLPQDLETFVSKSGTKGFIYFSMGSIINTDSIEEDRRKMLLSVFSKLKKYQIVWKWDKESMADKPDNVYLSKWLPQQDLLGHKNIKMFITHCGGGGTEEAIYHGVPLLGIPIMSDQPMNAKQAERLGFLLEMDWNELTEESLLISIQEVLLNPKYRNNVKKLSTIFKDQPDNPLTRGVYWIEYVMRHKGAPHLRSAARKMYYFQYHSWDVIFTYLFIIFLLIFIVFQILRFCFKKIFSLIFGSSVKESGVRNSKKIN